MKRQYIVTVINNNLEAVETYECKNKKEVKNLVNSYGFSTIYTVAKNNKLVKRLSSKRGLAIVEENARGFF